MEEFSDYGKAAVQCVLELRKKDIILSPQEVWDKEIIKQTKKISNQEKGWPKNTFLALCELGVLKGIPSIKCSSKGFRENYDYVLIMIRKIKEMDGQIPYEKYLWEHVE